MPDLDWNTKTWNSTYDWSQYGEEWSHEWGSSIAQWFSSIYPRIHNFLDCDKMVEIAPGFGRWTKFLISHCHEYYGFDISEQCVQFCQERFSGVDSAKFYLNNGKSLTEITDSSCDFVFSFDSLVHVEMDIISQYIQEILRIITPQGSAFIHHSNWKEQDRDDSPNPHNRAKSVSAQEVRNAIEKYGGQVFIQEKINWGSLECIDCLTLFGKNLSVDSREIIILKNPSFMEEAKLIRSFHEPYNGISIIPSLKSENG